MMIKGLRAKLFCLLIIVAIYLSSISAAITDPLGGPKASQLFTDDSYLLNGAPSTDGDMVIDEGAGRAYIATFNGGFIELDISGSWGSLTELRSRTDWTGLTDIVLWSQYLFISDIEGYIRIIDQYGGTDTYTEFDTPGSNCRQIEVHNNDLYVINENNLYIYDASNIQNSVPIRANIYNGLGSEGSGIFKCFQIIGNILYAITDNNYIFSIDISNPDNPQVLDVIFYGAMNFPVDMVQYNSYYLLIVGEAAGSTVNIAMVDVSNPYSMVIYGGYNQPSGYINLAIAAYGDYAVVGSSQVLVYNIYDMQNWKRIDLAYYSWAWEYTEFGIIKITGSNFYGIQSGGADNRFVRSDMMGVITSDPQYSYGLDPDFISISTSHVSFEGTIYKDEQGTIPIDGSGDTDTNSTDGTSDYGSDPFGLDGFPIISLMLSFPAALLILRKKTKRNRSTIKRQ